MTSGTALKRIEGAVFHGLTCVADEGIAGTNKKKRKGKGNRYRTCKPKEKIMRCETLTKVREQTTINTQTLNDVGGTSMIKWRFDQVTLKRIRKCFVSTRKRTHGHNISPHIPLDAASLRHPYPSGTR